MTQHAIMIAVRAPVEIVWSLLTAAANYPQRSSMLDKIDGRFETFAAELSCRAEALTQPIQGEV